MHRFVLGLCANDERVFFQQSLTRILCQRQATKCRFKIRSAPVLTTRESTMTGMSLPSQSLSPDQQKPHDLHGIYISSKLTEDSTLAIQFGFDGNAFSTEGIDQAVGFTTNNGRSRAIAIQFVFVYETLVSAKELDAEMDTSSTSSQHYHRGSLSSLYQSKTKRAHHSPVQYKDITQYLVDATEILGLDVIDSAKVDQQAPSMSNSAKALEFENTTASTTLLSNNSTGNEVDASLLHSSIHEDEWNTNQQPNLKDETTALPTLSSPSRASLSRPIVVVADELLSAPSLIPQLPPSPSPLPAPFVPPISAWTTLDNIAAAPPQPPQLPLQQPQLQHKDSLQSIQSEIESHASYLRNISPYDYQDNLFVVKRIRVCTFAIECSSKLHAVLKSCDVATCTTLLIKEALLSSRVHQHQVATKVAINASSDHERFQSLLQLICSHGSMEISIVNTVVHLVTSRMSLFYKEVDAGEYANEISEEDIQLRQDSTALVRAIFTQTSLANVLLLLFTFLMRLFDGQEFNQVQEDEIVSWLHILYQANVPTVIRMLYPKMIALSKGVDIVKRDVALTRDAMVSTGADCFLLDAGTELVFYRALTMNAKSGLPISQVTDHNSHDPGVLSPSGKSATGGHGLRRVQPGVRWLVRRLYEHPLVPKLLVAQAGTASAMYFTRYFMEDAVNSTLDYPDFQLFIHHLIDTVSK
jgi:hypothetical protein